MTSAAKMKETAAISLSTKNVFLNHDAYSCTTACKDKVLPQSILLLLIIDESCSVNYEVRLLNTIESDKSIEGSVQICYRNSWTPICSNTYYYYSSQKIGNVLCNSIEDSKIVTGCELQKKDCTSTFKFHSFKGVHRWSIWWPNCRLYNKDKLQTIQQYPLLQSLSTILWLYFILFQATWLEVLL